MKTEISRKVSLLTDVRNHFPFGDGAVCLPLPVTGSHLTSLLLCVRKRRRHAFTLPVEQIRIHFFQTFFFLSPKQQRQSQRRL